MRLRVYLDTSIISACYDSRVPDRQVATEEFWARLREFEVTTSELTVQELEQSNDASLRAKFKDRLSDLEICPITQEMKDLAHEYVNAGIFSQAMLNDGLHVAAAVLTPLRMCWSRGTFGTW